LTLDKGRFTGQGVLVAMMRNVIQRLLALIQTPNEDFLLKLLRNQQLQYIL
jgi:hypothetical protein